MNGLEQNVQEIQGGERIYPKAFNEAALDHKERYQLALNYIRPGAHVLDAATGVGYGAYYLAVNSRCEQVVGLDVNDHALGWANTYFKSDKNLFLKVDLLSDFTAQLPVQQFDVITSFETIEHLTADRDFLGRIHRLLKPGGVFLVSSPNEEVIPCLENPFYVGGKNPHHHKHYTPLELKQVLQECGFSIVEAYTQTPNLITRGEDGFVIVYVCTNVPVNQSYAMSAVEQAIEKLNLLQMRKEFSFLENKASSSVEITSIQHRVDEILLSYEQLMTAYDLLDQQRYAESRELLERVDKSFCPESYFWLGLLHQAEGRLFQAMECYAKLLDQRDRLSAPLVGLAEEQLVKVMNQLVTP